MVNVALLGSETYFKKSKNEYWDFSFVDTDDSTWIDEPLYIHDCIPSVEDQAKPWGDYDQLKTRGGGDPIEKRKAGRRTVQ